MNPEMPPIYGELEPKVAPLVLALRRDGFPTTDSGCGEGDDTIFRAPWVNVGVRDDIEAPLMAGALLAWLRRRGVIANVCCVRSTHPEVGDFIRVEVYSDLAEAWL